jgi:putative MFS transporter
VSLFSLGTILAALSSNVAMLIAFRFIVGMGIGAEIALVTTYVGELSPPPLRGRYTSWASTAAFGALAFVPFVARGLVPTFAAGWRVLFLIGALGGITVFFMRRRLPSSPRWLVTHGHLEDAEGVIADAECRAGQVMGTDLGPPGPQPDEPRAERFPVRALLRSPLRSRLVLLATIWFVFYIGDYGWLTLSPTLFVEKGYSLADSTTYLIVSGLGFLVGAYTTTRLSDRFERKLATSSFAVIWSVALLMIGFFISPGVIMVFGFIASATMGMVVPMLFTYSAEHFSTNTRATGVALTDGLGHIGGALAPLIVLGANSAWGYSDAFLVMAVTGLIAACLILLGVRATGRALAVTGS